MRLWLFLQFCPWIWSWICFYCIDGRSWIVDLLNRNLSPLSEFFWMNFFDDLQKQNSNFHWKNCLSNLHLLRVKWTTFDTIIWKQNSFLDKIVKKKLNIKHTWILQLDWVHLSQDFSIFRLLVNLGKVNTFPEKKKLVY